MNKGEIVDVEKTIRDYLPNILHMSLGTSNNGKPWVCEVHFVYDDELNLYWRSLTSRRHSQDIAANPQVAGSITMQHAKDEKPRGLYFEGIAQLHTDEVAEGSPLHKLFLERLGPWAGDLADVNDDAGRKFYKVNVSNWWLFDARESTPPQKYHLDRSAPVQGAVSTVVTPSV